MINKKSIWFLTLFSLILVLSVYYITMPSELLLNTNGNYTNSDLNINETTLLVALRIEADEEMAKEMKELQDILTNNDSKINEKNKAFEKMKDLNIKRGEEEKLENKIKEKFNLESFIRIKDDQIEVVIDSKEKSNELANNIMRSIQEEYENQKYITVKFSS